MRNPSASVKSAHMGLQLGVESWSGARTFSLLEIMSAHFRMSEFSSASQKEVLRIRVVFQQRQGTFLRDLAAPGHFL